MAARQQFHKSIHCLSGVHCETCRTSREWRESIKLAFDWDGSCRLMQGGILQRMMRRVRLGDKISSVTSAVGIKECGGCKKRKATMNGEG